MRIYQAILTSVLALAFAAGSGCNLGKPADSPAGTLKNYIESSQKKDAQAIKQTLSGGTLKMLDDAAKRQNTTLEEILTKDAGRSPYKEVPETRNEKIEGETATLEIKNAATADWDKIPFVREDGKWKIALDKFLRGQ